MDDVAPDGSPVDVYLTLAVEPDLSRVRAIAHAGASVICEMLDDAGEWVALTAR